jgi:TolB protein
VDCLEAIIFSRLSILSQRLTSAAAALVLVALGSIPASPLAAQTTTDGTVLYSLLQTVDMKGNVRPVYKTQGHFEAPNWTRDGQNLIFDQDGRMMTMPVSGGEPKVIDTGDATKCNGSHGLSPDGKSLAITCSTPGKPESRVYIIPLSGGTPRLVTEHPYSYWHSWSPDGKTIIFTRPDHGSGNIFAIPVEGGEEKALTTGSGISDDPDYSPDGKYIYFNSDRSGTEQIWRMHPDGSAPEQMTNDDRVNWTPHNSPDGKSIVFISYEHGTTGHPVNRKVALRILSPNTKSVRTLVDIVGGSGTMNVPSWAPDSKHFAFVSYQLLPAENAGSSR